MKKSGGTIIIKFKIPGELLESLRNGTDATREGYLKMVREEAADSAEDALLMALEDGAIE